MWRYDVARMFFGVLVAGIIVAVAMEVLTLTHNPGLFLVVLFMGLTCWTIGHLTGIEQPRETHEFCHPRTEEPRARGAHARPEEYDGRARSCPPRLQPRYDLGNDMGFPWG